MTQVQRLNLKFSVADVDLIKRHAMNRMTDLQIAACMRRDQNRTIRTAEIRRICGELGLFIRIDNRSA